MKKSFSLAFATGPFCLFVSLFGVGCTPLSAQQQIKQDLNSSAEENKKAENMNQWEMSEFNDETLFQKWRDQKMKPGLVCEQLNLKAASDLVLFEEDIKDSKNADLLSPCKQALLDKLDVYWQTEKKKLVDEANDPDPSLTTFKFKANMQTRDVSKGYTAVRGDLAAKEVILTFDDGPHPQYTDIILSALRDVDAKVIFFALGNSVRANPDVLRREAAEGHSIGSHSVTHRCLAFNPVCAKSNGRVLTYQESIDEILGGHEAVFQTLGWVDPFFRFPYGEYSPELRQFLDQSGTAEFFWTIDSEDWKNQTPQEMIDNTFKQLDALGKGIILFHDIQRKTAETLPMILKQLYIKGYSIVGIHSTNPGDRKNSRLLQSTESLTLNKK